MGSVDNKREYYLSKVLLKKKELDAIEEYTSKVRNICPKTGEYVQESAEVSKDQLVKRWIMFSKVRYPFVLNIRNMLKYKKLKWSQLTDKQKESCYNMYDEHIRKRKKKV
jgi:hypothetical protein